MITRNHRWRKGDVCEVCKVQRRTIERQAKPSNRERLRAKLSGEPITTRMITVTEYSRDGVTWDEVFIPCPWVRPT